VKVLTLTVTVRDEDAQQTKDELEAAVEELPECLYSTAERDATPEEVAQFEEEYDLGDEDTED
jgi:hypothetical protein